MEVAREHTTQLSVSTQLRQSFARTFSMIKYTEDTRDEQGSLENLR